MPDLWMPDCEVQDYPSKPPFSMYGSKQRLAAKICKLMPPHTVYVEPFCGSAAVFFKKGLPVITNDRHYREVLNDTNGCIINFFRVMQDEDSKKHLIELLEWTAYCQDDYFKACSLVKKPTNNMVEMAWAWFVSVYWSFSRKSAGGFAFSSVGENPATTHFRAVERLKSYRNRLKHTFILNESAIDVIKRFDRPQTLCYVDPPYPDTSQGHFSDSGFDQEMFESLIGVLSECTGAVMLSCYPNKAVPEHWEKHEFSVIASAKGSTGDARGIESPVERDESYQRTECLFIKPASTPMRPSLVAAAQKNYEQLRLNFEGDIA